MARANQHSCRPSVLVSLDVAYLHRHYSSNIPRTVSLFSKGTGDNTVAKPPPVIALACLLTSLLTFSFLNILLFRAGYIVQSAFVHQPSTASRPYCKHLGTILSLFLYHTLITTTPTSSLHTSRRHGCIRRPRIPHRGGKAPERGPRSGQVLEEVGSLCC